MIFLQNLFKYHEIGKDRNLQAVYYVLFLDLVFTFSDWLNQKYLTVESVGQNKAVCWPYFQDCLDFYVFNTIPHGYSLNILYMVIGGLMFVSLYFAYIKRWDRALLSLTIPIIFKFLMVYVFSYLTVGNFNVISVLLALFLLFSSNKLHNLKVLFTVFYLCAATIKLNEGYLSGEIFSSLALGLPLFPNFILPYSGIAFFLLVAVAPIFLWAKDKNLQLTSASLLTVFHVYSISMVGFRYPALCIPIIWLLFIFPDYNKFSFKKIYHDKFSFIFIVLVIFAQSIPFWIAGDERISSEGEKYGFYMYTANRQCVKKIVVNFSDGTKEESDTEERRGMRRCDPYEDWFRIKQACQLEKVKNVEWDFNVSINGSYFYNLVDTKDACNLSEYQPFRHNQWINLKTQDKSIPVLKNSI